MAAFGHYCGSVAGNGHVDFLCNNEADFFDRIVLAEKGAQLFGLAAIVEILRDFRALLPSANIMDVYEAWAKNDEKMTLIGALDKRLFAVKLGADQCSMLAETLSGTAKEGFEASIAGSKFDATDPHCVCSYAWLGGYAHIDHGTFEEEMAKTARIAEMLAGS